MNNVQRTAVSTWCGWLSFGSFVDVCWCAYIRAYVVQEGGMLSDFLCWRASYFFSVNAVSPKFHMIIAPILEIWPSRADHAGNLLSERAGFFLSYSDRALPPVAGGYDIWIPVACWRHLISLQCTLYSCTIPSTIRAFFMYFISMFSAQQAVAIWRLAEQPYSYHT